MIRKLIMAVAIVALLVGVFALNGVRRKDGKALLHVADEVPLTVVVTEPERRKILRIVHAPGRIEPVREVEISSQVVARIERMPFDVGEHVEAGDLLAELDDDDFRARVESGEARVAQLAASIRRAAARAEKAKRDCGRQERLEFLDATSEVEIADYRTALIQAEAELEMARQELIESQAMLRSAKETLEETTIVAPIGGIVASVQAKEGEVVVTGTMNNPGTIIMVISDLSQMQVRTDIDETDVVLVREGQPARIYLQADPETPIPGHVWMIAPKGTSQQGRNVVTFETLIRVESDDPRIRPAMNANVEIEVDRRDNALTIPIEAVVHRKRKDLPKDVLADHDRSNPADTDESNRRQAQYLPVVYCMSNEKADVRIVETGISDRQWVEITSGMDAEDLVITGPYRSLDQLEAGRSVKLDDESETSEGADDPEEPHDPEDADAAHDDSPSKNDAGTNGAQGHGGETSNIGGDPVNKKGGE